MGDDRTSKLLAENGFGPGFTPMANEFSDLIMPFLREAELKVALYIKRRTFGFRKPCDWIALSQICHGIRSRDGRQRDFGAGVSKPAAIKARRSLSEKGLLQMTRTGKGRGARTIYALVLTDRAKAWLAEEITRRQERVTVVHPFCKGENGKVKNADLGNSSDCLCPKRGSALNTQHIGSSVDRSCSKDEAVYHSSPKRQTRTTPGNGSRWLDYDRSAEFDQRQATYWYGSSDLDEI